MDAAIIQSSNRPLSKKKRDKLEEEPRNQIDTDAQSTAKNAKKYFGYKGHIGMDAGNKIIRKRSFTAANVHDSREFENVLSRDEKKAFGETRLMPDKVTNGQPENVAYITGFWTKGRGVRSCQKNSRNRINKNQGSEQAWNTRLGICERN